MFRFVVLLSAIAVIRSKEDFFQKYAYGKVMADCLGHELYYSSVVALESVNRDCQQLQVSTTVIPAKDNPGPQLEHPTVSVVVENQKIYMPVSVNLGGDIPAYDLRYGRPGHRRVGRPVYRQPREAEKKPFVDAKFITGAVNKIRSALSNLTCTLSKMDMIDEHYNMKFGSLINSYQQLPIDVELKKDLIDGLLACQSLAKCLPQGKPISLIPAELQRLIKVIKCEREERTNACFKHDLRKNIAEFDLSALPDGGEDHIDLENLVAVLIESESLQELVLF